MSDFRQFARSRGILIDGLPPIGVWRRYKTEDHPRNFDNSLYHGYVRDGVIYKTDGTRVSALSTSTEATTAWSRRTA